VAAGTLTTSRFLHSGTKLPSGKVLVAGGQGSSSVYLSSAELYDPATHVWAPTGALATTRSRHTATLLDSGQVLVAGGRMGSSFSSILSTAELYDPTVGTWRAAPSMSRKRLNHTATLLQSGRVLVVGGTTPDGDTATAELYDPATDTWTSTGSMAATRYGHAAVPLRDGKVLVVGGWSGRAVATAELYDPSTGLWTTVAPMSAARYGPMATLLEPSGRVLVLGGDGGTGVGLLDSSEVYDPGTGLWTSAGSMSAPLTSAGVAKLTSLGRVLVCGGLGTSGSLASSELYTPAL
jgi:hypothetical protein